ncbi:thioredoxin h [Thraustotheca clavata]|uniref:Thioredoxin n=1 Tax=Thraustotheca clavata TaxID=74557 RepID=A0A1W0A1T4_9STRA|nr:thioredoxin h [Thraustotheca clavata]
MTVESKAFVNEAAFRADITQEQYKNKLIVIDFTATWCPPCQYIKPIFHSYADQYPEVVFFQIDVDESDELSEVLGVSAMPTFQFWRNGEKLEAITGADRDKLLKTIIALK